MTLGLNVQYPDDDALATAALRTTPMSHQEPNRQGHSMGISYKTLNRVCEGFNWLGLEKLQGVGVKASVKGVNCKKTSGAQASPVSTRLKTAKMLGPGLELFSFRTSQSRESIFKTFTGLYAGIS